MASQRLGIGFASTKLVGGIGGLSILLMGGALDFRCKTFCPLVTGHNKQLEYYNSKVLEWLSLQIYELLIVCVCV